MNSGPAPTVFVVDSDETMRRSLERLFATFGLTVEVFGSPDEFLGVWSPKAPGCVVSEIRFTVGGMSGLDLLRRVGDHIPLIILTAFADVPTAVAAMKAQAFDYIEKPHAEQPFLRRVAAALAFDRKRRTERTERATKAARFEALTKRERDVLDQVAVLGVANKEAAEVLGISLKTVEFHRGNMMRKLRVGSVAELVRLVIDVGWTANQPPGDV